MKIAWFTPFSKKSAIGMVSREICEELVKHCEVKLFTPDSENLIEATISIQSFSKDFAVKALNDYDYIFYNMGNFAGYHRDIFDVLTRKAGFVILHDQTMAGFWGQYYLFPEFGGNAQTGFPAYRAMFQRYYGTQAAELCQEAYDKGAYPIYDYKTMSDYRLLEPILEHALGVFTHAQFVEKLIKAIKNIPFSFSYLPCKAVDAKDCEDDTIKSIVDEAKRTHKKIVVSNGIVHPTKQIDKITSQLLQDSHLREHICYIVIGSYGGDYGEALKQLSENQLKNCLHLMGYQSYEVMNYALAHADLCVNLRYPNSEVCSLSLLEQMSFGKPTLVFHRGIFGEMPENTVVKINYHQMDTELPEVLHALLTQESFVTVGQNAKRFVEENCTVEHYCQRLLQFIEEFKVNEQVALLQDRVLSDIGQRLQAMQITPHNNSLACFHLVKTLQESLSAPAPEEITHTIGFWGGFRYHVPGLNREGISRFVSFLGENMVLHKNVKIEVWAYSFNEEEMEKTFASLLADSKTKADIQIITEQNWPEVFRVSQKEIWDMGEINESYDNLAKVAAEYSKADVMIPFILYLDNVIPTGKRIIVPAHDMATSHHFLDFLKNDSAYKFRERDILYRASNLAKYGATFVSNCKTVLETQTKQYIKALPAGNTHYVYLPVNVPQGIEEQLLSEQEVRERFGITGDYGFYPTQVRPYKNIATLIRALNEIKKEFPDFKLVLTGNPKDLPEVDALIQDYGLSKRVILLKNLSEQELYSVYRYAAVVPVTSIFEGGFSWQACEALFMNRPLLLSSIDVVEERIKTCGFTLDQCGVFLYNPLDFKRLAEGLRTALKNPQQFVRQQELFAKKLLSYTWKDAADAYYQIIYGENTHEENV